MKKLPYPLLAFLLVFTLAVQARDVSTTAPYFDPATVNLKALLPDPPAKGSLTTVKEIDLILHEQAARTPDEVARIKQEVNLNVYLFENVLGAWFTEKYLPLTAALFRQVDANVHPVVESAKKDWGRPRPPLQDKRIHPPIDLPKNTSYPSGHSTVGDLDALILAELAPDLKQTILARGLQIGDDRVIAGVHFPSDVDAGRTLARDLFARLMASPAFQADLAKAKEEVAAARGPVRGGKS
jgi:membrane-associated phospholipid phosphatase